jgi:hypothetical protein
MLWKSRESLARQAVNAWLEEPNVHVTIAECVYGGRTYQLDDVSAERVTHLKFRASTLLWCKENLLNLAISQLPHGAEYILTADADVTWRAKGWASRTINALDLSPVVQPWKSCFDLGPNSTHMSVATSFAWMHSEGAKVVPTFNKKTMVLTNYPYGYPHPGFAWAWKRDFLDWAGGLFEWGGVGAGDHHMALALVGEPDASIPEGLAGPYNDLLKAWATRANAFNGFKLGWLDDTIEHMFHGSKVSRGYNSRWQMFLKYQFNPVTDVKRNSYGVLEFAGNKPALEAAWLKYLIARNEDSA